MLPVNATWVGVKTNVDGRPLTGIVIVVTTVPVMYGYVKAPAEDDGAAELDGPAEVDGPAEMEEPSERERNKPELVVE